MTSKIVVAMLQITTLVRLPFDEDFKPSTTRMMLNMMPRYSPVSSKCWIRIAKLKLVIKIPKRIRLILERRLILLMCFVVISGFMRI